MKDDNLIFVLVLTCFAATIFMIFTISSLFNKAEELKEMNHKESQWVLK